MSDRFFGFVLRLYPKTFPDQYGAEMRRVTQTNSGTNTGGAGGFVSMGVCCSMRRLPRPASIAAAAAHPATVIASRRGLGSTLSAGP